MIAINLSSFEKMKELEEKEVTRDVERDKRHGQQMADKGEYNDKTNSCIS